MNQVDVIGIDVSMGKSHCAVFHGGQCIHDFVFSHTQTGFHTLHDTVSSLTSPVIYFESTGVYSRPVKAFCENNQLAYVELNPLSLHFQISTLRRLKTDRTDAKKIAQFGIQYPQSHSHQFAVTYQRIRELTRFYLRIQKDIKYQRTLLHAVLQQTFPELKKLFSSRLSKLTLNVVALFPHPDLVNGFSRTKIKNILLKSTAKKLSNAKALRRAKELIHYANISYPAYGADSIQVTEVRYYAKMLYELTIQAEKTNQQLVAEAKNLPEFDVMTSMPGIGPLTASELIGEVGDVRRFTNNRKLNAYVGVDLNRYQSGTYTRQDHLNKRGDAKARAVLYVAVDNMIKQQAAAPNHIVDYYYRLKKGPHPKPDKVARVACMNKTLKCLLTMVKANQKYDYSYHGLEVQ